MAGTRRDMQDVELVDADPMSRDRAEAGTGAEAPAFRPTSRPTSPSGPAGPGRPAQPEHRRRRRRAGLLVLAAVLAVAGAAVGDRREERRLSDLTAVPGVLEPLAGPVVELWRRPDAPLGDLRTVAGRLVGAVRGPGGTVDVLALDPATGQVAWRAPVGSGPAAERWTRCVVPGAPDGDPTGADGAGTSARAVVACVVVDETATTEQSALGSKTYPTAARLVVVDAATGDVLRDAPTAPTGVLVPSGDDVVRAEVDERGRATATRLDPRTGAVRWTFTGTDPVPTDRFRQRSVRAEAAGDLVALDAGPVCVLSARDGSVVDAWPPDPTLDAGAQVQVLAGGTLLARPAPDDGGWGTEVVDVASGRRSTAPGFPVPVVPDDRSLADLVLMLSVEGRRVLAVDTVTGDVRWSVPAGSGGWPVVVDGRVVRAEGRSLRARDGRTGEEVWAASLPAATRSPVVTDGRLALVSLPVAGGTGVLTAVSLTDGRSLWSVAVDHELVLSSADGRLLGWTGAELIAFGAPANGR